MEHDILAYRSAFNAAGPVGPYQEPPSWRSTPAGSASALRERGLRAARARGAAIAKRFGFGVPFVPANEPVPSFLLPAFRVATPHPLVGSEMMLYRLRGATEPATFLDTGMVVETWLARGEVRQAVQAWSAQLLPHLTVYQLSDAWLMHDPYSENAKAFFVASPHFDRLF